MSAIDPIPGLTREEFNRLLLSVGKTAKAQRPLSPIEVGEHCAKSIAAGATAPQVAHAIKMTGPTMVTKFLRLQRLEPSVYHLVSWGQSGDGAIGFTVAAEMARLPECDHVCISQQILKYRLTRNELCSIIQLIERSGNTMSHCIERVVNRRPVVRVRQVILGIVTSSALESRIRDYSQLQRDALLEDVVRQVYPEVSEFTAKLGVDRFTIIGGKGVANTLGSDPDFESRLNIALEKVEA